MTLLQLPASDHQAANGLRIHRHVRWVPACRHLVILFSRASDPHRTPWRGWPQAEAGLADWFCPTGGMPRQPRSDHKRGLIFSTLPPPPAGRRGEVSAVIAALLQDLVTLIAQITSAAHAPAAFGPQKDATSGPGGRSAPPQQESLMTGQPARHGRQMPAAGFRWGYRGNTLDARVILGDPEIPEAELELRAVAVRVFRHSTVPEARVRIEVGRCPRRGATNKCLRIAVRDDPIAPARSCVLDLRHRIDAPELAMRQQFTFRRRSVDCRPQRQPAPHSWSEADPSNCPRRAPPDRAATEANAAAIVVEVRDVREQRSAGGAVVADSRRSIVVFDDDRDRAAPDPSDTCGVPLRSSFVDPASPGCANERGRCATGSADPAERTKPSAKRCGRRPVCPRPDVLRNARRFAVLKLAGRTSRPAASMLFEERASERVADAHDLARWSASSGTEDGVHAGEFVERKTLGFTATCARDRRVVDLRSSRCAPLTITFAAIPPTDGPSPRRRTAPWLARGVDLEYVDRRRL